MSEIGANLEEAKKLLDDKQYDLAEEKYSVILKADPNEPAALVGLARICQHTGDIDKALSLLEDAVKLSGENHVAHHLLGKIHTDKGLNEKAVQEMELAIASKKDFGEAYAALTAIYRKMKKYDMSIATARMGIAAKPDDGDIYYQLGETQYVKDDIDEAIKSLEKTVELKPKDHQALSELSYMYSKKEDLPSAIKNIGKAYGIIPYSRYRKKLFFDQKELERAESGIDATDYFRQAENLYAEKKTDEAITYLDKALEMDPRHLEAYVLRGFIRYGSHKYVEAIQDNLKALEVDPRCQQAHYLAGKSYGRLKNEKKALKHLEKAAELLPEDDRVYNSIGLIYVGKDYSKALEQIRRAINLYPKMAEYYANRGMVYEKLEKIELARKDYEKALKINPKYTYAQKKLETLGEKTDEKLKEEGGKIEGYR